LPFIFPKVLFGVLFNHSFVPLNFPNISFRNEQNVVTFKLISDTIEPKRLTKGRLSIVFKHKIQSQNKKITMGAVPLSSMNIAFGISNYMK
jgi:hypothetical protein